MNVTDWERKFDSEMNIAIEQRKAMHVHITRVQVPYLCFVIRMCSVIIITQREPEVSEWDNVTVVLVSLP